MREETWIIEGAPFKRKWLEGNFKEQPMRNTIKVLDKDKQQPKFLNIELGSMFRYPKSNDNIVYMKGLHFNNAVSSQFVAVHLTTGEIYNFDVETEIEPVTMVQISR